MWLSWRDCAHLFARCLEADYGYEIVYGISDNDRKYYSLERAKEVLGYDPVDDSAGYEFDGTPKAGTDPEPNPDER
jgi:NAD+ dependent glucose-6-phosphate dehydrogenase